jgi:hypothetical protein
MLVEFSTNVRAIAEICELIRRYRRTGMAEDQRWRKLPLSGAAFLATVFVIGYSDGFSDLMPARVPKIPMEAPRT